MCEFGREVTGTLTENIGENREGERNYERKVGVREEADEGCCSSHRRLPLIVEVDGELLPALEHKPEAFPAASLQDIRPRRLQHGRRRGRRDPNRFACTRKDTPHTVPSVKTDSGVRIPTPTQCKDSGFTQVYTGRAELTTSCLPCG